MRFTFYHGTNKDGMEGIVRDGEIKRGCCTIHKSYAECYVLKGGGLLYFKTNINIPVFTYLKVFILHYLKLVLMLCLGSYFDYVSDFRWTSYDLEDFTYFIDTEHIIIDKLKIEYIKN